MKTLVTGATGFVGANLVRRLVHAGHEVHVLARRSSNYWRIKDLLNSIHVHETDLRDAEGVQATVATIRPTVVFHLATFGGFSFQKDITSIIDANFYGTVNLLRACEKAGFDYFVNTGSSSEYGVKPAPMREDDLPEPLGEYGVTKAAATLFCQSESRLKSLPVVTLRLFSPYGEWDDAKRLIPYALQSLLRGNQPRLAAPTSVRDYVYIDDVVDCYLKVVKQPGAAGQVFNVGSGLQVSVGDLVSTAIDVIGSSVGPRWGERGIQRIESPIWVADIKKAEKVLDWRPNTDLRTGLTKTSVWMKDHMEYYPED